MKKLLFRMLGAAMIVAAGITLPSCSKDNNNKGPEPKPNPTAVNTLSVTPSSDITFEASGSADVTLTVTTDADGWEYAAPAWITAAKADNKLIVTASDNAGDERKGEIKFTAGNAPAVTINVTQQAYESPQPPDPSLPASLQGSAYITLLVDPFTYTLIQSKVVQDLRPDDSKMFIDIWESTMGAYAQNGTSFYGYAPSMYKWFSVSVVAGPGWSGGGQRTTTAVSISDKFGDDWYFHMAIRSNGQPHGFKVWGAGDGDIGKLSTAYNFGVGGQFNDAGGGEIYPDRFSSISMDGEWQEYEIPVADMKTAGWVPWVENNLYLYSFISGGTGGRTLELDAIFFYKK